MVTFETQVYEKDWEFLLIGDRLDQMIARCNYPFKEKILLINDVEDRNKIALHAGKKVAAGIIDKYYFVEDYLDEALAFFDITKESFRTGIYYSTAGFVGMYLCKTEYLLHVATDVYFSKSDVNWIDSALDVFSKRKDIIVANPLWNNKHGEAKKESSSETDDFYVGYGFSDQCYLIGMSIFKNKIYGEKNPASERYPSYGGECLEKRIDAYMRNHNLLRITSKKVWYIHKGYPKNPRMRELYIRLNRLGLLRLHS